MKLLILVSALLLTPIVTFSQSLDYNMLQTMFGEPVTISAIGKPQRVSQVPVTMEIITSDQIHRSAFRDIPNILRRFAGIDVYSSSLNGNDVSIRGYTAPMTGRVLVLIDGRQLYNDSFGFVSWNLPIDIDEIRQIEIIKGPQSALYGFNAASGVINIITFEPLDTQINQVKFTIGSQSQTQQSAIISEKYRNFATRLSFGGYDSADLSTSYLWLGGDKNIPSPKSRFIHSDNEVQFEDGGRLRLDFSSMLDSELRLNSGFLVSLNQDVKSVKGEYTTGETDLGVFTFRAYRNQFDTIVNIPDLVTGPLHNSATVASIQDLFKIDAEDSLRISTEFRSDESSVFGNPRGQVSYNVWSTSAMWDRVLSRSLSWTNALRFDYLTLDRTGPINPASGLSNSDFNRRLEGISYNSDLVWKPSNNDTVRFDISKGAQLPSLFNLGAYEGNTFTVLQGHIIPVLEYGNPFVKTTTVYNYEISWDHNIPELDAKTRASIFYQKNKNMIAFAPNFVLNPKGTALLSFVNYGDSSTLGLEMGITGSIKPDITWGLNYTLQGIDDSYKPTTRFPIEGNKVPTHKINARLGYTHDNWDFDIDLSYVSSYYMPDLTKDIDKRTRGISEMGNYVMVAPRIAYHITPNIEAAVSACLYCSHWELPNAKNQSSYMFTLVGKL